MSCSQPRIRALTEDARGAQATEATQPREKGWNKLNVKEGTAAAVTGRREGLSVTVALTSSWMSSLRSTLLSCPMRRKEEGVS